MTLVQISTSISVSPKYKKIEKIHTNLTEIWTNARRNLSAMQQGTFSPVGTYLLNNSKTCCNMLLSTMFNSLLEELKNYIKVIPLTEQMQHMPKHKKSPMLLPTYFLDQQDFFKAGWENKSSCECFHSVASLQGHLVKESNYCSVFCEVQTYLVPTYQEMQQSIQFSKRS